MEEIGRGQGVVEGAVIGLMRKSESVGEGPEFAVGYLVADEPTREWDGVDHDVGERITIGADQVGVQETDIEAGVVGDDDRVADEVKERWQNRFDRRRRKHHRLGDAREDRDERGDRATRVHERLEGAEAFAAAVLHGTDLGDPIGFGVASSRLEVEDAERDVGEWRSDVDERLLLPGHLSCVLRTCVPCQGLPTLRP